MASKFTIDRATLEGFVKTNKIKLDKAVFNSLDEAAFYIVDLIQTGAPKPQRDTGYMQGSYSFHIGKTYSKTFEGPDRKTQPLPPNLDGISDNELRISFQAPYAAAQQQGFRIKNGKRINLTPRKPGTGPGWLDKIEAKRGDILDFIEEKIGDYLQL